MFSIPLKLLYDSVGHSITVEMLESSLTGKLLDVDDYYNITVIDCIFMDKNGKKKEIEKIILRGSNIKYIVLPKIMKFSAVIK